MIRALLLLFCLGYAASPLNGAHAGDARELYLVKFDLPRLDPGARQDRAHVQALVSQQQIALSRAEQTLGRPLPPSHRFLATHNGVAIALTAMEARQLAQLPGVADIRREQIYQLATWNSPLFINAEAAWTGASTPANQALLGRGRVAAVLDTGLPDTPHPSFSNDPSCSHGQNQPDKLLSMVDCSMTDANGACSGPDPFDRHGHGSHVAAILAGNRIDRSVEPRPPIPSAYQFMSGVAPCASIRSYKVCPSSFCPESHILAGLNQVLLDADVDVLNFSISGGRSPWADNDRAKLDLVEAGVVVVAAAGNTGAGISNPVGQVNHLGPWVLSVAASSRDATATGGAAQGDVLAGFSLRGPTPAPLVNLQKPDLTAPGIDIRAAAPGGYALRSGTSMASPHVAGAALLVREAHSDWSPMEVKSALRMSAVGAGSSVDGETPWHADQVGSGRVDLETATRVGLVLDEQAEAFLAARPELGGDVRELNLPALRDRSCTPHCTWTRVLRNSLPEASLWQVVVEAPEGLSLQVSPAQFSFSGGLDEKLALTIAAMPLQDLSEEIVFAEIRLQEQFGQSPDLRLTVAVQGQAGAGIRVAPAALAVSLLEGQSLDLSLALHNPGAFDLDWQAQPVEALSGPARAEDTVRVIVPPFSLGGGGVTELHHFEVEPATAGYLTSLFFRGAVGLESTSWASDLRMRLSSAEGAQFTVGGYDSLDRAWDFQGVQSASSDIYASTHQQPFGDEGVLLAGTWQLEFSNDFAEGGRMDWRDIELHLTVDPGRCRQDGASSWLGVSPASGTTPPGGTSELALTVDAAGLTVGKHQATLCLGSNALGASLLQIPVRLDVFPQPESDQALVSGQVFSHGPCGDGVQPLASAELRLAGADESVLSAVDGRFFLPVAAGAADQVLMVSAAGHQALQLILPPLGKGEQHSLQIELALDRPCADLQAETTELVLTAGEQTALPLMLSNTGAADLDWQLKAGTGPACQFDAPDWISGLPTGSILVAGSTAQLALLVDSHGMAPGQYSTRLCLFQAGEQVPEQILDLNLEIIAGPESWTLNGALSSAGRCGQAPVPLADALLSLVDADGRERQIRSGVDGSFRFGADSRFQPYHLTAQAPGHQSVAIGELSSQPGEPLQLDLSLSLDQPCAQVWLDSDRLELASGDAGAVVLNLDNQAGAAALSWQLSFAQALPPLLPDGRRPQDPALDELVELPDISLMPPGSDGSVLIVEQDLGLQSSGRIIGLSFVGEVEGISAGPGRASDLQLRLSSPDSSDRLVGGFSSLVLPWQFQGPASDIDGSYQSSHWFDAEGRPLFGDEGVADQGRWRFALAHDWASSQAEAMAWSSVQLTLHKMASVGCHHPAAVAWLDSADDAWSGVVPAGEQLAIPILIDAGSLAPGHYQALICLGSSDLEAPRWAIDLELIVEANVTRVFTDRFETVK